VEEHTGFDTEEEEDQKDVARPAGQPPHARPPYTRIDTSPIEPTGTGCRACVILILLIGAILGFVYISLMSGPSGTPTETPTPSQPQGYEGQKTNP
jgi:hypothetical protein